MRKELTKIFTQVDAKGFDQSDLIIKVEVDINTADRTAEFIQLIYIKTFNHNTRFYTDITHIMFNTFHNQAENMIDSIDWWTVYRENRESVAA